MNQQLILTNARVVLYDEVFEGTVAVTNGIIESVDGAASHAPSAIDLEGDYLLPGLVELHTDALEKHFAPRPGVKWPALPAVLAHDAVIASAGITTVFNAVATGDVVDRLARAEQFADMIEAIREAVRLGVTKAEHLLHIRCEVAHEATLENFRTIVDNPLLKLVSIMDHSPGQRQFVDLDKYREYYQGKFNLDAIEMDELIQRQTTASKRFGSERRSAIVALSQERGLALASHDDATIEHVADALGDGMTIAEFPTTVAAARASRERGMHVLMGAPNVVRGASHSGNVSARDLAAQGLLDTLSSDYVPASLLQAAFVLDQNVAGIELAQAVAMVSANPAAAAGLEDRGRIAPGRRADLVRVRAVGGVAVIRQVWRQGERVA